MASSSTIPSSSSTLPIFLLFLSLMTPLALARFPSSSVASDQINFWSKNVLNSMPEAVVSKLSPLTKQDSESLSSSVSKPSSSIYSDARFCSMANLACAALQNSIMLSSEIYRYHNPKTALGSDKADPTSFFRLSALQNGKKIQLPNLNDQFPPRAFLPSQIASKISTTTSADLQKLFPNSLSSIASKETIETSISACSSPSLKSEVKSCPNSLEDMIEFSKKTLGATKLMALASESTRGSKEELGIGNIKQFQAEKVVACHELFFPFATYFCHSFSSTRLYSVHMVEPTTKAPVNQIMAMCHMDTSEWPAEHPAFKILKFSPGRGEACHWFKKVDLVWIGQ